MRRGWAQIMSVSAFQLRILVVAIVVIMAGQLILVF